MKRRHLPPNSLIYLIIAVVVTCGSAIRVLAQDSASNERGFQPGNSYALSNIESINMVNGNVGLSFPLASLPVGRGGLTASINLLYNSKLYDSEIAYFRDESQSCEVQGGDPPEGVLVCPYYQKRLLKPSEDGGWRYGMSCAVTRVEYTYDNPSVPANLTQVRTWDSTKGGYSNPLTTGNSLTATTQYNQYGMPTLVTDPRGLKTLTTYGQIGSVSDLYPTQIKVAYQTAQERTEAREYDLGTGLVTRVTDVNNDVSTFNSFDVFGRPTLVRAAEGKPEETESTYEYSDALRRVITPAEFQGTEKLVSIEHYDQLGRVRLSRQLETAAQSTTNEEHGIKVQTRYRFS